MPRSTDSRGMRLRRQVSEGGSNAVDGESDMAQEGRARQLDPRSMPLGDNPPHRTSWAGVWIRAVIVPASQRAEAAMLGCGIVAAVVFGPTAMRPADLTGLALHVPAFGAVLAVTWLLVFVPTARMIVRAAPAAYLESLPGNPRAVRAVAAASLIVLQL